MALHEVQKKIIESAYDAMKHPSWLIHICYMDDKTEFCVTYETIDNQIEFGTGDGKANQFYFSIISHDTEIWSYTVKEGEN